MIILATICMIPYTFTVIIVSFFKTMIPSKSHCIDCSFYLSTILYHSNLTIYSACYVTVREST
jgi:hypothetical protein